MDKDDGGMQARCFTKADRRRLGRALAAARKACEYRRLEATLLVAEGHSISEAARRLRVARLSVRRWVERYLQQHDVHSLVDRLRCGRPRQAKQLTPQRLAATMARDPLRCGYLATTWTVPLLVHYLAQHDGIEVSQHTLRRRLHEAGWRWKRPRYVFSERAAHVAQKKGA
ncbi:helix-turn-helix domain-containing protein [Azohydromonas lata]|uniref:helix-turn-helix domain-containing protein n=1 Tax=Azohydromonas lata TaxID=45677 RepID=UPI001C3F2C2F|nr:helix-turn-helix domain-containing protein [Azohydromonas lata]